MAGYSARYDAALALAARAHRGQSRKGSDTPYIVHVVHVAAILERHGLPEDLVLAGLLHDVVEDSGVALEDVALAFGEDVARLVDAVTERKQEGGAERPWEVRKEESLAHLRGAGPDAAALKAADAIHNARSTAANLREDGPGVWSRFKRGPEQSLWYYRAIAAAVAAQLPGHPIAAELADAVEDLARAAG